MQIPDYYCPHCGRFKKKREVDLIVHNGLLISKKYIRCKHCGCEEVMDARIQFEEYLRTLKCRYQKECERKECKGEEQWQQKIQ